MFVDFFYGINQIKPAQIGTGFRISPISSDCFASVCSLWRKEGTIGGSTRSGRTSKLCSITHRDRAKDSWWLTRRDGRLRSLRIVVMSWWLDVLKVATSTRMLLSVDSFICEFNILKGINQMLVSYRAQKHELEHNQCYWRPRSPLYPHICQESSC